MSEATMEPTEHPADVQFEGFVTGALEGAEAETFEAHVVACPACTKKLAAEARLEEQLYEIAAQPRPLAEPKPLAEPTPIRRPRRWGGAAVLGVAAALAAAAAITLLVVREEAPEQSKRAPLEATPPPSAIPVVVCDQLMEQAACIERAHRRGLYVRYPTGAGAPPIGGASTGGPSSSPFPLSRRSDSK